MNQCHEGVALLLGLGLHLIFDLIKAPLLIWGGWKMHGMVHSESPHAHHGPLGWVAARVRRLIDRRNLKASAARRGTLGVANGAYEAALQELVDADLVEIRFGQRNPFEEF